MKNREGVLGKKEEDRRCAWKTERKDRERALGASIRGRMEVNKEG